MVIPFRSRAARSQSDEARQLWTAWQQLGQRLRWLMIYRPAQAASIVKWVRRLFDELDA